MAVKSIPARRADPVKQFSIFTANRIGRLHDLIVMLNNINVHVLALMVLDTTDSAIIRTVVDDPDAARSLLNEKGFAFTESDLVAVEVDATTQMHELVNALLGAELNINYLYSFIVQLQGKSIVGLSMDDNELAESVLKRHQFRVLKQADISR